MNRSIIIWAAIMGAAAISLGALGAHALKGALNPDSLESFKTGVRYQAWHAIALLALGFSNKSFKFKNLVFIFWTTGSLLFSVSIYFLSTSTVTGLHWSFLGPVTPIGGLLMIVGWILLFIGALKYSPSENQ